MNDDAIYLVAMQVVRERQARAEREWFLREMCATCCCTGWRVALGRALVALGEAVEGVRREPMPRTLALHGEGG